MTIRIVTDSTCDLPVGVFKEFNIAVVPCFVNFEEKSYLDMVDLSRQEFYQKITKQDFFPKTAAPSVGLFTDMYNQLASEGADEIISIHYGGKLSNMSNVARLAADAFKTFHVTVVEVGQVALSLGFLVVTAARAVKAGKKTEEIKNLLKDKDQRTYLFAALDTLEFIKRGGRVPQMLVELAGLLQIKPVVLMRLGNVSLVDRIRTSSKQIEVLVKHALQLSPLEEIGIVHMNALEKAHDLADALMKSLNLKEKIWIEESTPVLGVHVGPGTLAVACVKAAVK
jgi:DegV family protein with EDD domain